MPSSRIPSPARSHGTKSTPRRYKPRASRSVGSPARSNSSVKLTTVMQLESFNLSPMPTRRSVLTDTTDIDIPRRKSWWKKLDENSREIMEVLDTKEPAEANNAIEEYIEVDVLSQEKKNYTLDLPESSDGESINSIVIPQRKLFTLKENQPQNKFAHIIDNRESLATLHKTQIGDDKTLNVVRKNLLNQGTKQRTKPIFPLELLNVSANKTVANKTKELANTDAKRQVKNLFGNRPGTKRKNIFTDFIVSDSEDEIPEIQPKVFGFQKKTEQRPRKSLKTHANHEPHVTSPTSSTTDIEMDDWKLLPSSTMVDHQLEDELRATPVKRARLGKLSEAIESIDRESNTTSNKTKKTNKSLNVKSKSINLSKLQQTEDNELIAPAAVNLQSDTIFSNERAKMNTSVEKMETTPKNKSHEQIFDKETFNNKELCQSKNISSIKLVNSATCEKSEISRKGKYNKASNTLSKIDQVLQSDDDDEDFTLVYENDDNNEVKDDIIENEAQNSKGSLKAINNSISRNVSMTKPLQVKLKPQSIIHPPSTLDDPHTIINEEKESYKKGTKYLQISVRNTINNEPKRRTSNVENTEQNGSKCNISEHGEKENQNLLNSHAGTDGHEHIPNHRNRTTTIYEKGDDPIDQKIKSNQVKQKECESDNGIKLHKSINEKVDNVEQNASNVVEVRNEEDIHDTDKNDSQEAENDIDDNSQPSSEENDNSEKDNNELDNQKDDENQVSSLDIEIDQNKKYGEHQEVNEGDEGDYNEQDQDKTIKKSCNIDAQNDSRDEVDNKITENKVTNYSKNQSYKHYKTIEGATNEKANKTHDTTNRHSQKNDGKIPSPEVILHDKPSQMESFTVQGRNTSVRKTKSIIKNVTIRQSLAPVRESIGLSDGSSHSCTEGSGWDSHRTTRATLRQTFGKDFTPRKSIRALVMEKSARRQTNLTEINAEFSRFPQANSTELTEIEQCAISETNVQKMEEIFREKSFAACKTESSGNQNNDNGNKMHETNQDMLQEESDAGEAHEMVNSDQERSRDNKSSKEQENNESHQENENNGSDDAHEMDESNPEKEVNESSNAQEINESNQEESREIDESLGAHENCASDTEEGIIESDDAHEHNESHQEELRENDESVDGQENCASDTEEEMIESDDAHENNESDQEESRDIHESGDIQTNNQSDQDNGDVCDGDDVDTNDEQELNESTNIQEINETNHETSHNIEETDEEVDESNELDEKSATNIAQEINEYDDECEYAQEVESDHEMFCDQENTSIQEMMPNHEESRKTRQTTLEMYLQKVKQQNTERKKQLEEEVRNSLKAPTRDMLNPFKVPAVPKLRRIKAQPTKPKTKPIKSNVISLDMLPAEVLEDMKYKPPKRYRPTNASWITKRLYKFLETKLEPKYDYKARVRSEKLVETIYNFTKDIRRHSTAPTEAIDALKHEMARLDIVQTHFEFYEFFHEYMPREVRVKVVPDVFNKISLPKRGVFSDILR